MNISQERILTQIVRYLTAEGRSHRLITKFKTGAYCHSLAVLAVYGLYLKSQTTPSEQPPMQDDWIWLKSTLTTLDAWDENNQLPLQHKQDIERLITLLEYFQHISTYQPGGQGNLTHYLETTDNQNIRLEYSFAGLFTAHDFNKKISVNLRGTSLETSLIKLLTHYQHRLILVSKGKHTLSLFRNGSYISLYDANATYGRKKFHIKHTPQLVQAMFRKYRYHQKIPSAFGFRIFTFASQLAYYPKPESLLTTLHHQTNVIHQVENMRYSALHIAARVGSTGCIQYYLQQQADVNLETPKGTTPLHIAAEKGHVEITEALLEHGANTNIHSTLKRAAKRGFIDVLVAILYFQKNDALACLQHALAHLPSNALRNELIGDLLTMNIPHLNEAECEASLRPYQLAL